jgi:hypothetical protein
MLNNTLEVTPTPTLLASPMPLLATEATVAHTTWWSRGICCFQAQVSEQLGAARAEDKAEYD